MNAATRVAGNNSTVTGAMRPGRRRAIAFAEARSPLGFRGGLSNLTDYVGDNPTNATDPSGLSDTPQKEDKVADLGKEVVKDVEIVADKAGKVKIGIYLNPSYTMSGKDYKKGVAFTQSAEKEGTKVTDAYFTGEWLQIAYFEFYDKAGKVEKTPSIIYYDGAKDGKAIRKYFLSGKEAAICDTFDVGGGPFRRSKILMDSDKEYKKAIVDSPNASKDFFIPETRVNSARFHIHFYSVFVVDGKPYYLVEWEYNYSKADGESDKSYNIIEKKKVTQPNDLPPVFALKKFARGFETWSDDGLKVENPFPPIDNPIAPKYRPPSPK